MNINYRIPNIENLKIFFKFFKLYFFINLILSLTLSFSIFTISQGIISIIIIFLISFYYILKTKINGFEKSLLFCLTLFGVLFWIFLFYPALNGNDDLKAYLFFQEKTANQGFLSIDPFSARRMYSLGGLYPFQGSLSYFDLRFLSVIEPGLGLLLISVSIIFLSKNNFSKIISLAIIFLSPLLGAKILANTIGVYTLIFFTFVILHCYLSLINEDEVFETQNISIIIFSTVLSLTIKPIPFVFNSLIIIFLLVHLIKKNSINFKLIQILFVLIVLSIVYLFPFLKASYESSGTFFYPFLGDGFRAPSDFSSQKFNTYAEINNILELFKVLYLPVKDYFFIFVLFFILILYLKTKNLFLVNSIAFAYFLFYFIILFTVGSDINLVKRYTLPISISVILFIISSLDINQNHKLPKKYILSLISIFVVLMLSGSWFLKENLVNSNRKKIVNTFTSKKGAEDIKKLSSMINFNTPVLINSMQTINLYNNGFNNLIIFDAPLQVQPWLKNNKVKKKLKNKSKFYYEEFYNYIKNQNIEYIIFDNYDYLNVDLKEQYINIFLKENANSFKLNHIIVHKLIY